MLSNRRRRRARGLRDVRPRADRPEARLAPDNAPTNYPETRFELGSTADSPVDSLLTRMPADPYATFHPDPDTVLDTQSTDAIPGYELLERLGEGGM